MAEFFELENGDYINLNHVVRIEPSADALLLRFGSGREMILEGDDARALLARLKGKPPATNGSEAAERAQELSQMLSKGNGRQFSFVDSRGRTIEGTVYRVDKSFEAWTNDNVVACGSSEAQAMQELVNVVEAR